MKFIRRIITTLLVLGLVIVGLFLYHGHQQYEEIQQQADITYLVQQVQEDENFVSYNQLPENLVNATVSIEDRRYFEHGGVDYIGLLRALVSQFNNDFLKSGGSTITQQTAKNLYSRFDSDFLGWKGAELFFARELEKNYSKEEIFAIYVNIINYGDNNQGIYEASWNYFGVDVSELNLAQCSILAGIPQSPSNYELSGHYDNAKTRQKLVLNAMVSEDYITQEQADIAYNEAVI